jgi:uncharacterized protein YyaL (SSP411 family)
MMISAFAKGAQVLDKPRFAEAARGAVDFVRRHLWDDSRKVLLRRHREGESAIDGFLDDYAFMGLALLDLYEATFTPPDLAWAVELADRARALFEDVEGGGFFSTSASSVGQELVLRLKDDYDGAEPSGNSGMALLLLRLARMTDRADLRRSGERTLQAFSSRLEQAGTGVPQMLVAHAFALAKPREVVLAGPADDPVMREMLAAIRRRFMPSAVVMRAEQAGLEMPAVEGRPTAYVCENFTCKLPVTSVAALDELLE